MTTGTETQVQSYVNDCIERKLVHEIHTSERKSYRACRRRWSWIFRENYYPLMTAKPLEFGTAFHQAMETYYDPKTWEWDRDVVAQQAILDFVEKCETQRKAALEFQGRTTLDTEVQQDYDERVELGKGMLNYYFGRVAPAIDGARGWKPVAVEIAFMVPIPNPDTGEEYIFCKCNQCRDRWLKAHPEEQLGWLGLPVVYAGRLDMLAKDENGDHWIFDWKTARSISDNYEFLYLDDQVGSYVWALNKLGLNVRGFVYHEQRKGFPQPPKKNKQRRLGALFSVAKNQDVDYETYLTTVAAEDPEGLEAGAYEDMLSYLRNEGVTFYDRHQILKTRDELDEIEINIANEAMEMIDPATRIYPSPGRFGCNFCAFRQPCLERNNKGDFQYALDTMFEQREHYYVRAEASTESKGGE